MNTIKADLASLRKGGTGTGNSGSSNNSGSAADGFGTSY